LGDYMLPIPPIKGTRFHSIDWRLFGTSGISAKNTAGGMSDFWYYAISC